MTTRKYITALRGTATLALVLIGALIGTACDSSPASVPVSAGNTPVSGAPTAPARAAVAAATRLPANKTNSKLDCQALANAALDFNGSEPFLVTLAGSGGSAVNRVDESYYVDTAKLRADLDVLAALPDPTDPAEVAMMGRVSEAIPQWRQLLDLVDRDANAGANATPGSTPPAGATGTDQQLLDFTAKIMKMSLPINAAMGAACPNASANIPQAQLPTSQATPLTASYQIGQTAPVGALRVTFDKVVTASGGGASLPSPGNRLVFVFVTVANTGKTPFQVNTLTGTHWEDANGKRYFRDPYSTPPEQYTSYTDVELPPGAKQSGVLGYQLPTGADNLVWVFEDFKPNRAVFAVKAGDIVAAGTPVTEPTENALRAQAAATQTAFVEMVLSVATQEAAGTDTPAPPEATGTAVP